ARLASTRRRYAAERTVSDAWPEMAGLYWYGGPPATRPLSNASSGPQPLRQRYVVHSHSPVSHAAPINQIFWVASGHLPVATAVTENERVVGGGGASPHGDIAHDVHIPLLEDGLSLDATAGFLE